MNESKGRFSVTDWRAAIDLETIGRLLRTEGTKSDASDGVIAARVGETTCLSLLDGERLIGFALFEFPHSDHVWFANIIVEKSYRGGGLGQWLFGLFLAHPTVRGRTVRLHTDNAHAFYRPFGFVALDATTMERRCSAI